VDALVVVGFCLRLMPVRRVDALRDLRGAGSAGRICHDPLVPGDPLF